jgi:RNA polymerase sigma factor (sigma-70 family)
MEEEMASGGCSAQRPRGLKVPLPVMPSEPDLLAGLGQSDPRASAAFIQLFQRRVFGLAKSIVADPELAEEIAQEAFVRAWRHAGSYDSRRGPVSAWLLRITRNLAIDALRKHRAQPMDPERLTVALGHTTPTAGPEASATLSVDRAKVRRALRQLPPEQRRAIVLAVFFGRTGPEIAQSEGIPLGTVKARTRLGMVKLRKIVSDDEPMSPSETTACNLPDDQEGRQDPLAATLLVWSSPTNR